MNTIKELEALLPETVTDSRTGKVMSVEEKYRENFNKYARYEGNGVYQWKGLRASDTQHLFIIGVLRSEGINFNEDFQ